MRRPPVLFSSLSSNHRNHRGVLRHALLASAWSVPTAVSAVAESCRSRLPIPLYNSSNNNNNNILNHINRNSQHGEDGNPSDACEHMYAREKVVDSHRTFLRKGREASATTTTTTPPSSSSDGTRPAESREVNEDWGTSADVTTTNTITSGGNSALQAFHRWSEKTGSCTPLEFVQGVQQSYYGLGVLLGTLAEAVRPQSLQAKAVPLSGAITQLKSLLVKQYGVSPSAFTIPTNTNTTTTNTTNDNNNSNSNSTDSKSDKKNLEEEGGNAAKLVSQALMQVLPISPNLAEELYYIWNKQRTFEANLFCVAGPTDYILSTNIVLFHECHKEEVHVDGDGPFKMVSVPFPSTQGKRAGTKISLKNFRRDKKNNDININTNLADGVNISKKEEEMSTTSKPSVTSTATANAAKDTDDKNNNNDNDNNSTHKSSIETEENQEKEQTIITYKGKQLPPIPADALACVLATVDVVTPPQRYAPTFDWFYKRITGYENEYERIAAARIFAMSNAHPFVVPLDFLLWMFTGRHVEFICKNGISAQIGIPKNIGECPPATRKMMCFYMDANRRWVLSDLLMVDSVLTTMIPRDATA